MVPQQSCIRICSLHAKGEVGDALIAQEIDYRGKHGSKIHLITERTGPLLSTAISGANVHDSQAPIPLVQGILPVRFRRGRRRRRPDELHGDKSYDYNHLRRWSRGRGTTPRIARKGTDSSRRLGRHHRTIERTTPGSPDADASTDATNARRATSRSAQ